MSSSSWVHCGGTGAEIFFFVHAPSVAVLGPDLHLARPEVELLLQRRLLLLLAGGSKFYQCQDQERGRNTIQACCDQKCRIFWKDAYGVEGASCAPPLGTRTAPWRDRDAVHAPCLTRDRESGLARRGRAHACPRPQEKRQGHGHFALHAPVGPG